MTPVITLQRDGISPSLRRYASEMKLGLRAAVRQVARSLTRIVIDLTPPGSEGTTGAAAYRQGRQKIARQMDAVFAPVKLKGRRKITTVFGRKLKRPVYVPTTERFPDVAEEYRKRAHATGTGIGIRVSRGAKAYIDVRKFRAVLAAKQSRVGLLASGWSAAANALDVPVAAWIARHGPTTGSVQIDLSGDRMSVIATNYAPGLPAGVRAELKRRLVKAVEYQANTMERAIAGYHTRTRQQLGISGR